MVLQVFINTCFSCALTLQPRIFSDSLVEAISSPAIRAQLLHDQDVHRFIHFNRSVSREDTKRAVGISGKKAYFLLRATPGVPVSECDILHCIFYVGQYGSSLTERLDRYANHLAKPASLRNRNEVALGTYLKT